METIIYQGQEVRAQLVNSICGDGITTSTPKEYTGEEELLRDEAGRYYLRQRIDYIDPVGGHEHGALVKASGRRRIHRINLNAAILWATTRLNSITLDLRADAADLLTEGRGYTDPTPTPPMRRSVELAATADAPATFNVDSDTITVPLTLPVDLYRAVLAMGESDGRASFAETVQCSMDGDVVAWLNGPVPGEACAFLNRWLAKHPLPAAGRADEAYSVTDLRSVRDEVIMATLDAHVTRLLHAYAEENPKEDPRDTINGLLACLLECEVNDASKRSGDCVAEACKRRLKRERAVAKKEAAQ